MAIIGHAIMADGRSIDVPSWTSMGPKILKMVQNGPNMLKNHFASHFRPFLGLYGPDLGKNRPKYDELRQKCENGTLDPKVPTLPGS